MSDPGDASSRRRDGDDRPSGDGEGFRIDEVDGPPRQPPPPSPPPGAADPPPLPAREEPPAAPDPLDPWPPLSWELPRADRDEPQPPARPVPPPYPPWVTQEPPEEHPPHFQSRNPVDRLTRGLPHPLRVAIDWAVTIAGAIAIVLLVKAYVVNPYRIPSSSMEPTLHCAQPAAGCEAGFSDRVLANRFIYHLRDPERGEIVVFETPPEAEVKCGAGGTFVKRLIGLPGETVEVRLERGSAYVYIDGRKLEEPYVELDRRVAGSELPPTKVPANGYFMMGDNRSQSCDSRVWGAVPRENLIGKVFATYWPPNRLSLH